MCECKLSPFSFYAILKLSAQVCFLVIAIDAAPQVNSKEAYVTRYDNDIDADSGSYSFGFESSDGTRREETGKLINPGTENEFLRVSGSYSYVGLEGKMYHVEYIADENGYRASTRFGIAGTTKPTELPPKVPVGEFESGDVEPTDVFRIDPNLLCSLIMC